MLPLPSVLCVSMKNDDEHMKQNFRFPCKENMAQHEHDYLISHSHNLRIFISEKWKRKNSRLEFIILINVENVSDVNMLRNNPSTLLELFA